MASDLSSGCAEAIEVFDEKEEGEISLEDVSSSEEGHLNYGYGTKTNQCTSCLSRQHSSTRCAPPLKYLSSFNPSRDHTRREVDHVLQNAVHGKENQRYVREPIGTMATYLSGKRGVSTLHEKNDDLVPISSDSDMEIVGLMDNSVQTAVRVKSKGRSKHPRKKKRSRAPAITVDDFESASSVDAGDNLSSRMAGIPKRDEAHEPKGSSRSEAGRDPVNKELGRTHRRDLSPVHRRYRTAPRHNSLTRSRSPFKRDRSPTTKRLPRKTKSPRRSPRRERSSPVRDPSLRKLSQFKTPANTSPSYHASMTPETQCSVQKLLKKVRQLDTIGTQSLEETLIKNREHASSLKEKLLHMMRTVQSDDNGNVMTNYAAKPRYTERVKEREEEGTGMGKEKEKERERETEKEKEKEKETESERERQQDKKNGKVTKKLASVHNAEKSDDLDEDDDLALLRQKALETKQKKTTLRNEPKATEPLRRTIASINDDQDEEDLQLRMIALRSAVLKKHQNRVQRRGLAVPVSNSKQKKPSRSESPFTQSFLDSIPMPGENLLDFASPPRTPPPCGDINHSEDMEIDTDVEREKEKLPYSPTDKITADIPIDTELLGIQPSDVSFISLNLSLSEVNSAQASPSSASFSQREDQASDFNSPLKIVGNRSFLPKIYSSHESLNGTDPMQQVAIPSTKFNLNSTSSSSSQDGKRIPDYGSNVVNSSDNSTAESMNWPIRPWDQPASSAPVAGGKHAHQSDDSSTNATNSLTDLPSPTSSLITIDDLPEVETDLDPYGRHSTKIASRQIEEGNTPTESTVVSPGTTSTSSTAEEPLYMQGLPDITKEVNKIPTLVNRTLVPAPVLKSNKHLQQPLPIRKHQQQPNASSSSSSSLSSHQYSEATFKSAEMKPVSVPQANTVLNSVTNFKPMKFPALQQKPFCSLVKPTVTFNEQRTEEESQDPTLLDRENETGPKICTVGEPSTHKESTTGDTSLISAQKRKKVLKTNINKGMNEEGKQILVEAVPVASSAIVNTCAKKSSVDDCTSSNTPQARLQVDLDGEYSSNDPAENGKVKTEKKTAKQTSDRRESLEEDEEALRAILLASLPPTNKRTKIADPQPVMPESDQQSSPVKFVAAAFNVNTPSSTSMIEVKSETISSGDSNAVRNQTIPRKRVAPEKTLEPEPNNGAKVPNVTGVLQESNSRTKNEMHSAETLHGRKRIVTPIKGIQRKMTRKMPIAASTRVVNNAKKYQNIMIQKRLNLQKTADVEARKRVSEGQTRKKVAPVQSTTESGRWSANSNLNSVPENQRIVINLQSDTESESDSERQTTKKRFVSNSNDFLGTTSRVPQSSDKASRAAEFEKNLDQFLRDVRKKQESVAATRPTRASTPTVIATAIPTATSIPVPTPTTTKEGTESAAPSVHTPLAVRHLPASQQEEYRRLKQQILEREKLKLRRATQTKSVSLRKPMVAVINQASAQSTIAQPLSVDGRTTPADTVSKVAGPQTKPMTNFSITIANDNPVSLTAPVVHPTAIQETTSKVDHPKASQGLRILSGAEINRKFFQVQVSQQTEERIVTVNEVLEPAVPNVQKESKENEQADRINSCEQHANDDTIAQNNNAATRCESNIKEFVCSVEGEIVDNETNLNTSTGSDTMDSNASTIPNMRKEDRSPSDTRDSFDASASTVMCLTQQSQNSDFPSIYTPSTIERESFDQSIGNCSEVCVPRCDGNLSQNATDQQKKSQRADDRTNAVIKAPSPAFQEHDLKLVEQQLVAKRYAILNELAEMSTNLRQWLMEEDLQACLVTEVKKLREQLQVAEERLQVQRDCIKAIGPKVESAHNKINLERQEFSKLSRICSLLGNKVHGKDYKIPEAGAQLLESRLKEIANHSRQLSKKKVSSAEDHDTANEISVDVVAPGVTVAETEAETEVDRNTDINDPERICETLGSECVDNENNDNTSLIVNDHTAEGGLTRPQEETCESVTELSVTVLEFSDEKSTVLLTDESAKAPQPMLREKTVDVDRTQINVTSLDALPASSSTPVVAVTRGDRNEWQEEEPPFTGTVDVSTMDSVQVSNSKINMNNDKFVRDRDRDCDRVRIRVRDCETDSSNDSDYNEDSVNVRIESSKKSFAPYVSILKHLKCARNTNPNGVLCPYELMGTCNDGDCHFVHQNENQAK